jgi:hypothetical protein
LKLTGGALGSDVVTLHVGSREFTWKTPQADELAEQILSLKERPT